MVQIRQPETSQIRISKWKYPECRTDRESYHSNADMHASFICFFQMNLDRDVDFCARGEGWRHAPLHQYALIHLPVVKKTNVRTGKREFLQWQQQTFESQVISEPLKYWKPTMQGSKCCLSRLQFCQQWSYPIQTVKAQKSAGPGSAA